MSADILLALAWKSTALTAAVLVALTVMRDFSASHRAAVGGLGLSLLALLPIAVLAAATMPVPIIEVPVPEGPMRGLPVTLEAGSAIFPLAVPESQPSNGWPVSLDGLIAMLWAAGTLLVLLQLAAGLLTLNRWKQAGDRVTSPLVLNALREAGAPDATVVMVSDHVAAPLSWGWRSPVILVGRDTLSRPDEAEAVIAHEAAHLHRRDWARLLAARLAVALLWFNPLVWLLERRHLQDVEEAADAAAASRVEPAQYAQILLNIARGCSAPAGANSMARGMLSKRISEILHPRTASPRERMWRSGALVAVAVIAVPVALTQFAAPAMSAAGSATPPAAIFAPSPKVIPVSVASPRPATTAEGPAPVAGAISAVQFVSVSEPARPIIDRQALDAALKAAEEARAHAAVAVRDAEQVAARARAEVATQMANMRGDMLRGADDMERGAVQMRQGAAQMREEARKLRDPAYRAEQIRKAAARGDRVPTDQELIDAIPKMLRGADQMDAGVDQMRDGAKRMREQARRS